MYMLSYTERIDRKSERARATEKEGGAEGGIEGGREAYEKIFTIRIGHLDYKQLEHQGTC